MIKYAWESTQSTSRSAFRIHKMAIKWNPLGGSTFQCPCHYVTTHSALSVSCFTQLFAAIVVFLETYKKIYVIRIIRPPSGLRNSGHLILHLKKIFLHIEWCSSCYLKWEWILLLSPLTHFYCIKFSSKSFKRIQHSFTLFIISTNNFNKQALHLSRVDLPSPHSCVLRLSIMHADSGTGR